MGLLGGLLGPEEQRALLFSTMAGLSTTVGAAIAIVKRPDDALLALLLGLAFGVMLLLSVAELWIRASMEHGWLLVTCAVAAGAALYALLQPLLPDFEEQLVEPPSNKADASPAEGTGTSTRAPAVHKRAGKDGGDVSPASGDSPPPAVTKREAKRIEAAAAAAEKTAAAGVSSLRQGELLRLSFLMAFTMTLHNLPEGFAVAFSSYTDFGGVMAAAIAAHNIPEGIIVAAPIYAATGSKWRAVGMATASGLSEPIGALVALLLVKPFVDIGEQVHYLLAFVGGVMGAVCVMELLPEGRKCKHDGRFVQGALLGAAVMSWTLTIV